MRKRERERESERERERERGPKLAHIHNNYRLVMDLFRSDVQEKYNVVSAPGCEALVEALRVQLRAGWRAAMLPTPPV